MNLFYRLELEMVKSRPMKHTVFRNKRSVYWFSSYVEILIQFAELECGCDI